jgi:hypothetical protein
MLVIEKGWFLQLQDFVHHAHYESNFCADLLAKVRNTMFDSFSFYVSLSHFVISQFFIDI